MSEHNKEKIMEITLRLHCYGQPHVYYVFRVCGCKHNSNVVTVLLFLHYDVTLVERYEQIINLES